jgi:hypothetical protein
VKLHNNIIVKGFLFFVSLFIHGPSGSHALVPPPDPSFIPAPITSYDLKIRDNGKSPEYCFTPASRRLRLMATCVRFAVLTALIMKITVTWVLVSRNPLLPSSELDCPFVFLFYEVNNYTFHTLQESFWCHLDGQSDNKTPNLLRCV